MGGQLSKIVHAAILCLGTLALGCNSGGGIRCSFDQPARLAASSWPKFQRDLQNTGAIPAPRLHPQAQVRAQFADPSGLPFASGPVLGNGGASTTSVDSRVYVGSASGTLYALASSTLTPLGSAEFSFSTASAIRTTPLVAIRQDAEVLFFGNESGFLYAVTQTGSPQPQVWPLNTGGAIGLAPALNPLDGTVYATSAANAFYGVCPNGVRRFANTSIAAFVSAPAMTPDGKAVYGGDDRILRMERGDGFLLWSLSLAAPLRSAPVIELDEEQPETVRAIYAVDTSGRLFKVSAGGQLIYSTALLDDSRTDTGLVSASPALRKGRLYVATTGGDLLAVDTGTGTPVWSLSLGGEVHGSIVVLDHGDGLSITVPSSDGNIYVVPDLGPTPGGVQALSVGAPVRTPLAVSVAEERTALFVSDDAGRVSRLE